jgi:NAD(P)-dependent dehydrogenase (short-subunit alcohol dehydrogenase family)
MAETVLISGANRGLGLALTVRFLQAKYQVFAGRYSSSPHLISLLKQFPDALRVIPLDVTNMDSIREAAQLVAQKASGLDILINNAAVHPAHGRSTLETLDLSDQHLEEIMATNTFGPLRMVQQFQPLLANGNRKLILNITSEAGSIADCGRDREFGYCMSKAALNMQTKMLHNYLGPQGFTVLGIHPGWVQSDMGGPDATVPAQDSAEGVFQLAMKSWTLDDAIYMDYKGNILPW